MKVQVLMSTFNGEKYLSDQVGSLLKQTDIDLQISIRDDGSSDQTQTILTRLAKSTDMPLSISFGPNMGVIASFFELLESASIDAKYYSFCDQDDIWNPHKLHRAATLLETIPSHIPAIYCSRTELVDENLRHLAYWPAVSKKGASFSNAIIENITVGCTMVINKAARDLILKKLPNASQIIMHDWWIYLCVSAFGQVVYDPVPHIQYRQHGSNVMGGAKGGLHKWLRKWQSFRRNYNKRLLRKQAAEFHRQYGSELSDVNRRTLDDFLNYNQSIAKRLVYSLTTKLYRQNLLEHLLFKFLYLMNRI